MQEPEEEESENNEKNQEVILWKPNEEGVSRREWSTGALARKIK